MGSIFSFGDLLDMVRRRLLVILGIGFLGTVLSVLFALSQQHQYTSSEVLQMQTANISQALAPTTVEGSSARRLQLIEQQVMSRGAVLETAEKLGLFDGASGLRDTDRVDVVRRAVSITGVAAAREGFSDDGTVSLLRINATWPTPEGAQMIAHEFARRTVELSTNTRLAQAEETLSFFKLREDALKGELNNLESEITAFRVKNDVAVPGGTAISQREIERLKEEILFIDRQMIALQRRIAVEPNSRVERRQREEDINELNGLVAERTLLSDTVATLSESLQGSPEVDLQMVKFNRQLEELREQLQSVQNQRKEAAVSYQLEAERQSERLTVLEPAPLPDYPYTRARKQIVILGMFASFLAGFGAAFLLDLRNPVIRTAAMMERQIGLRPVITIPKVKSKAQRRPRPKRRQNG